MFYAKLCKPTFCYKYDLVPLGVWYSTHSSKTTFHICTHDIVYVSKLALASDTIYLPCR